MMKLQNILTPQCTICAAPGTSKKRILEYLSNLAAQQLTDHDEFQLLTSLTNREKMGSTGIGNGIAIPHGRLSNSDEVIAVFLTTETPIDFDAIDNQPVDIFICLFVPQESTQTHLETLQSIARFFSDRKMAKRVRKCTNEQEMFNLIQQAT